MRDIDDQPVLDTVSLSIPVVIILGRKPAIYSAMAIVFYFPELLRLLCNFRSSLYRTKFMEDVQKPSKPSNIIAK